MRARCGPSFQDSDPLPSKRTKQPDRWFGREGEYDPHKRMPDMDSMGIDISVLFPTRLMGVPAVVEDPGLASAISRAYNDWLAEEYCSAYPDRLKGTAMIPVQDPKLAVQEMRRAADLGMVAGIFIPHVGEKLLDNDYFFPIYDAAQEIGLPIAIHTNSVINPSRHMMNYALGNALNTFSSMMGLGSVVFGGVLDKFPRLKFAFLESGGGWVPYVMERMTVRQKALPHLLSHLERSVEEYMRSDQLYYSVEPDELTVPAVAQIVGEERLVMGSDYAHFDGSAPESIRLVMKRTDISDDLKRKILSDNPARLYKI